MAARAGGTEEVPAVNKRRAAVQVRLEGLGQALVQARARAEATLAAVFLAQCATAEALRCGIANGVIVLCASHSSFVF